MTRAEWLVAHQAHLRSDYWAVAKRKTRMRVVERYGDVVCEGCGVHWDEMPDGLECHHLHYRSWRRELDDLACIRLLCRTCHQAHHLAPKV